MTEQSIAAQQRLLLALAEELKLPLLQIARATEAGQPITNDVAASVNIVADMALRLVDTYILSFAADSQRQLELEPVAVSSVLQDAAHRLSGVAKHYDNEVRVDLSGKYGPIMGERKSLEAAFTLLGYSLLTDVDEVETTPYITLGAHRSVHGIVAGVFASQAELSADALRRARALNGSARQTLPNSYHGNGAGVFVADSIFRHFAGPLKVSRHNKLVGLAATLLPSQQMQLV